MKPIYSSLAPCLAGAFVALTLSITHPVFAADVPHSADWSRFRGPTGMGTSDATNLPVTWSASQNIKWKTPMPGPGASSPVVLGEKIFLTCYTGYFIPGESEGSLDQLKRHLVAVNRVDGKILWNQAIAAKLPEEPSIRDHGYAASTPVVDAERVYVFFGKSGVFAFDHAGRQVWQADVGSKINGWGSAASPIIYNNFLIINASVESDSLVALNKQTGKEVCGANGIKESWNTPLIVTAESGRHELIVAIAGKILAFDPDTGKPLWNCKTDITWYMVPSLVAAKGVVYCLGGRSGVAALAVRTGGSGDVSATHRLWTGQTGSNVSSPIYHDGYLYWAHESLEVACCAKADTGEIVYRERLNRAGQFYASALLADGKLHYVSRSGKTFVLAAKPQFQLLATNDLKDGGVFNSSPTVEGNRLLIRSDKFLYCIK